MGGVVLLYYSFYSLIIYQAIFGDEKFYPHYLNADLFKVVYILSRNVCLATKVDGNVVGT